VYGFSLMLGFTLDKWNQTLYDIRQTG